MISLNEIRKCFFQIPSVLFWARIIFLPHSTNFQLIPGFCVLPNKSNPIQTWQLVIRNQVYWMRSLPGPSIGDSGPPWVPYKLSTDWSSFSRKGNLECSGFGSARLDWPGASRCLEMRWPRAAALIYGCLSAALSRGSAKLNWTTTGDCSADAEPLSLVVTRA